MAEFNLATPDVEKIAKELIEKHHSLLAGARIAYMFRGGKWSSKQRETWGSTYKASDRDKTLHEYDFLVVVNEDMWHKLKLYQKQALIDHLLSHCTLNDETGVWGTASHDLEDFAAVVRRHGTWNEDVAKFLRAAEEGPGERKEQMELAVDGEEDNVTPLHRAAVGE